MSGSFPASFHCDSQVVNSSHSIVPMAAKVNSELRRRRGSSFGGQEEVCECPSENHCISPHDHNLGMMSLAGAKLPRQTQHNKTFS